MNTDESRPVVHRNVITVRGATIDGLHQGLLAAAQTQSEISDAGRELVVKVFADIRESVSTPGLELWPELTGKETIGDLLVFVTTLRSLYFAFLSPEELEEFRASSDFNLKKLHDERVGR
jgi:hypothetical protein